MRRTGGKSPPPSPAPPGSWTPQGRGHRRPLELLPGGTMSWQLLWLGFLLPMTVSGRALGTTGKEAAVVSPLGKRDTGGGREGWEHGLPSDLQLACLSLPSSTP